MSPKRVYLTLAAIFLAALLFRLYFAFQTPHFSPDAYFDVRHIEHIKTTGLPIFHDALSYSGRTLFFLPFFHYLLAAFATFLPLSLVLKVIPNIFAASLVLVVYLISLKITKRTDAALAAAFASAFIPAFLSETVSKVSVYSFAVPLMFFLLYCLMNLKNKKFALLFISLIAVLAFTHSSSLLLITALLLYLLFVKLEGLSVAKAEAELVLFSAVLVFWLTFMAFREPLVVHGLSVVWQNIPQQILSNYFADFNALVSIYKLGLIPFLAAIFVIYKYLFKEKFKEIYLFMSFALMILLLLWLKLIKLDIGLMMLAVVSVVLFSQFYKLFTDYLQNTKFSRFSKLFIAALLILLFLSSVLPAISYSDKAVKKAPSQTMYDALLWLKNNAHDESVVMAPIQEGHLIAAVAERRNVMDSNFLFIKDVEQRFKDIQLFFTTPSEVEAIRLLNKYNASYIFLTEETLKTHKIKKLSYTSDKKCFELVYDSVDTQIYRSLCEVKND
jgi:uncharacterized membrane protein